MYLFRKCDNLEFKRFVCEPRCDIPTASSKNAEIIIEESKYDKNVEQTNIFETKRQTVLVNNTINYKKI